MKAENEEQQKGGGEVKEKNVGRFVVINFSPYLIGATGLNGNVLIPINLHNSFWWRPLGKGSLWKHRCRWEDNIKIYII
jgi:hypothetical protein